MGANLREEINVAKSITVDPHEDDEMIQEDQQITTEKLKAMLPNGSKVKVNQSTVDMINKFIANSECRRELMEERLFSYTHLLGPGVGIKQLLKAIQFVTLAMTPGLTQTKAYMIVNPDKATELIEQGREAGSFASQYAATKLVKTIMEGVQIGPSVTYAPVTHQCVSKLMELMNGQAANGGTSSATVQLNATMALLDYIKPPEDMTINLKQSSDEATIEAQNNLAEQISKMAELQMAKFRGGQGIRDVQRIGITVGDVEVIDD